MPKYKVEITEYLQRTIEIDADNENDAIAKVSNMYHNEEIVLSVLTQSAVNIDIDRTFVYSLTSNAYISVVSTLSLAFIGTIIIHSNIIYKSVTNFSLLHFIIN